MAVSARRSRMGIYRYVAFLYIEALHHKKWSGFNCQITIASHAIIQ